MLHGSMIQIDFDVNGTGRTGGFTPRVRTFRKGYNTYFYDIKQLGHRRRSGNGMSIDLYLERR